MARFKIRLHEAGSDTKGTYAVLSRIKSGPPIVDVWCPGCGRLQGLGDHRIQDDGTVEPSLDCFYDDCKFHDHVVLEGWKEG